MTKRKFYKRVFKIEVLSEEPIPDYDLENLEGLAIMICAGPYSGNIFPSKEVVLNGKEAAEALLKQGSESAFFMLNDKGNDVK